MAPDKSAGQKFASDSADSGPARGASGFLLTPGESLAGRYEITRALGRGGMGEVYEAKDHLLRESVALKILRADAAENDALTRNFQREVTLARKVTHTNVCRVFDLGVHTASGRPFPFFTMELLAGETLAARISRVGRLSHEDALAKAVQIAEGLGAAHEAGVVHADFKSGNVLLAPGPRGERSVITDFGLSRINPAFAGDETQTMIGRRAFAGTLAYMSPEQMSGATLTPASDIYSFGVVLFEMVTGQLPFHPTDAIRGAVQRGAVDSGTARTLSPDLDPAWDGVITRCLQTNPSRRFATAADVAEALSGPRAKSSRRRWLAVAAASATVTGTAVAFWMAGRPPYQPKPEALEWQRKGVAALHSMTYEAARRAFEQAVAADPQWALAHAGLARAYEELDYSDLAKESMLRAIAAARESRLSASDSRKLDALQFVVSRDYDKALPLYLQIEREAAESERPAAALESGWLAQQREDTAGAARAYERALQLSPSYAAAHLRKGLILGRRRDIDGAMKEFREAEDLYNASSNYEGLTEALLQQATLLNRSSRSAEAAPLIERALRVAATVGNVYQQLRLQIVQGVTERNLGNPQRASVLAQEAIESAVAHKMDNLASSALVELGNAYLVRGQTGSAEPVYRRALALAERSRVGRNRARALMALGSLCEQDHRPAEARSFIEQGLPFYRQGGYRREFVQGMAVLGGVEQQLADFDRGVAVLREALPAAVQLHDDRTEASIRERLAENLRDQGAWPDALEQFQRAAALSGVAGAQPLAGAAGILWRAGRREEALGALSEAEKLLGRMPNSQVSARIQRVRLEMAYSDGHWREASHADPSDDRQQLIAALCRFSVSGSSAVEVTGLIDRMQAAGRQTDAADARLVLAEAMTATPARSAASRSLAEALAEKAMEFFGSRRIWESVWRAQAVAARVAQSSSEREGHVAAARAALGQLKAAWPPRFVEAYLSRAYIRRLSIEVQ